MVNPAGLLHPLDIKLLRDLWRMRGQAVAVALVAMCGIASLVTMRSSYEALVRAQAAYYEQYRFADVFANVRRAPMSLLARVRDIPGVNEADGRVVFLASLDVPGLDEPATAKLVSLPEQPGTGLNRIHLRAGRLPLAGGRNEALVSDSFAQANRLVPGDTVQAVVNGRKERLRIVGIAISPEFVAEIMGNSFPDNRRFGVMWMTREQLAGALDMRDAFNDLSVTLAPHAAEQRVIEQLDALLGRYGSFGAYGRDEHVSHHFLSNELATNRVTSSVIPAIFLCVTAFLIHNVLLRTTSLQRAQIALIKSFGYGRLTVGWHYMKFALATVLLGALAGIALGAWLGNGLAELYARFYHFPELRATLSGFSVSIALLAAVASALVGAALAVRRVLGLPPAEAMRPEAPARFRRGPLERLGLQRYMPLSLRMVLRNLERRPGKALLSIFGLALAVSMMVTGQYNLDALNEIIRLQFRTAQRDDVTVMFNEARDASVAHNLAALPGVLRVEAFNSVAVKLRARHRAKKTVITGLGPSRELRMVLDERERPIALPPDGIVLTAKLAEILGARHGDMLTAEVLQDQRQTVQVRVAAIVDEPIGIFTYMDRAALARLTSQPDRASGAFLAVDPRQRAALYRALKNVPAVASVNLREATLQSFMDTIAENMHINTIVQIAFACMIVAGVIYNSARISLSEHATELASLRILGFTRAEVGRMLLGEQGLLTLAALPLGCLLGYGLAAWISLLLSQEMFRIPLIISTRTYAVSVAVVLGAAVVSGLIVWRKIRSLDLIEVLKTRE